MSNLNINIFSKVYKHTLEMLTDRKYIMDKYSSNISNDDLLKEYNENKCKMVINKNKKDKVSIYFFNNKLGLNELKDLFVKLKEENVNHVIIITKEKLTSYAKKEMKKLGKNMEKEIFYFNNLVFNITKHELVPKHELLTQKETELFIKNIGKKIPQIKITDKVCRYYNGKVDQIFKIYRKNEIYYRIVAP